MGSFLEKPKVEKHSESGRTTSGIRFALSSMQGWRVEMEDAHTALCSVQGFPTWSFFGVYDGHAGAGVSARCSTNLLPAILENIARIKGRVISATLHNVLAVRKPYFIVERI